MNTVRRRAIAGRHTVRNRVAEMERIECNDSDGPPFDLDTLLGTGARLTEESFGDEPGAAGGAAVIGVPVARASGSGVAGDRR
ncbi:hypothetical protein [Dactylosporangium sp. CA-092794]|uniref:hypothetical protein n=1 Tax=Dactylosporangium sp. CA-092794 TaxID=3239929 RepID=UPI003D8D949A